MLMTNCNRTMHVPARWLFWKDYWSKLIQIAGLTFSGRSTEPPVSNRLEIQMCINIHVHAIHGPIDYIGVYFNTIN